MTSHYDRWRTECEADTLGDAYTGSHLVQEFYDDDDVLYEDIEVEIDDWQLHSVVAVGVDRSKETCEMVLKLMKARSWEYDGDL